MNHEQQIELNFNSTPITRPAMRRQRRLANARWWFAQMRRVVDAAADWQPASAPRAEQAYLVLPRGRV